MNKQVEKTLDVATHPHAIKGYIGIALTVLSMLGYNKVGAPAMDTISVTLNDMLVSVKAREVKGNIIINQQEKIINYLEMFSRLNYRKSDIDAVKKEMLIEKEWD